MIVEGTFQFSDRMMEKSCWDLAVDTEIDLLLWIVLTELFLHGSDISLLKYPCEPDSDAIAVSWLGNKGR